MIVRRSHDIASWVTGASALVTESSTPDNQTIARAAAIWRPLAESQRLWRGMGWRSCGASSPGFGATLRAGPCSSVSEPWRQDGILSPKPVSTGFATTVSQRRNSKLGSIWRRYVFDLAHLRIQGRLGDDLLQGQSPASLPRYDERLLPQRRAHTRHIGLVRGGNDPTRRAVRVNSPPRLPSQISPFML